MKLTFCGAAQEVTGSCYLVQSKLGNFLVDCGLFQGGRFAELKNENSFPFDPQEIDFVVLTHAHLDHCGRLPLLYKRGFRGQIYCTEPTAQLTIIVLLDAAKLMRYAEEDEGHRAIFNEEDVEAVRDNFARFGYHQSVEVKKGITLKMWDAGHILGSSIIQIELEGQSLVFSGDLGNPPVYILRPTEIPDPSTVLVIESTYGDTVHKSREESEKKLTSTIRSCILNNGVLLVPAFAIERTQEILYHLNKLIEDGQLPKFPIFLDSPMAQHATEVFRKYPEYYNFDSLKRIAQNDDLFDFPGLNITTTRSESMMINECPPPKMIIAGSGMMHGGRIRHHLKRYITESSTNLLIIGFQVEGTLGRQLLDGAKSIRLFGKRLPVKASITSINGFSAHSDQPKLLHWIKSFQKPPKTIFITHGEINQQLGLAEAIESQLKLATNIPTYRSSYTI